MSGWPALNVLHPFAGTCWVCGGPDKRHRLADAIVADAAAGRPTEDIADDYSVTQESVLALVAISDRNRKRHKRRWAS